MYIKVTSQARSRNQDEKKAENAGGGNPGLSDLFFLNSPIKQNSNPPRGLKEGNGSQPKK
jgi:hypothetical protein